MELIKMASKILENLVVGMDKENFYLWYSNMEMLGVILWVVWLDSVMFKVQS